MLVRMPDGTFEKIERYSYFSDEDYYKELRKLKTSHLKQAKREIVDIRQSALYSLLKSYVN